MKWIMLPCLILVAALAACEGLMGPEGPQGEQVEQGPTHQKEDELAKSDWSSNLHSASENPGLNSLPVQIRTFGPQSRLCNGSIGSP
tara:strand:+ start:233 stop:493 length:261 start_codon:yes stop_codon:yes gene_type:complete